MGIVAFNLQPLAGPIDSGPQVYSLISANLIAIARRADVKTLLMLLELAGVYKI